MTIFNPDKGRAAFDALLPRMQALAEDQLAVITTNVESAAMAALAIAQNIKDDSALYARFMSLPQTEFEHSHLGELDLMAWATIHAHAATARARAHRSQATLPATLIERAIAVETRMQACCEYHLADDPVAGPTIIYLRGGTGYRDLAQDLLGYAALYREYHNRLYTDSKNYRSTDIADAVSMGEEIIQLLGGGWTSEDQQAVDHYTRAWTLLYRAYNNVRDTGHWLLRHDKERGKHLLPSLILLGRSTPSDTDTGGDAETGDADTNPEKAPDVDPDGRI